MNADKRRRHWLCAAVLACTALTACSNEQPDDKDRSGMFGLFGKKATKTATTVAAEVGATLQAQSALPKEFPPQPVLSFPACDLAFFRGDPPAVQWAKEEELGETRRAYRVPASAGAPAVAFVRSHGQQRQVQVWELSAGSNPAFVKQRQVTLEPAQKDWLAAFPQQVTCLPAGRAAVAIGYEDPLPRDALYIYNTAANTFRPLGRIEPDTSAGPPFVPFETLNASPDAVLLAFHTGEIRLGPSRYVYQHDHIVLFTPRYPDGLEIVKLGIDDGNLNGWRMHGSTLWLQTIDKRKTPREFIWSLDLQKVL